MKLAELQTLFYGAVIGAVPLSDPRIPEQFAGDARLAAPARLEIYADMYFARLLEALQAEFPMLQKLLGECAFAELSRAYLGAHPSEHPDIAQVGGKLADFIRAYQGVRGDLAELAELERARSLAFGSLDVEPRSWDELAGLGPERFPTATLKLVPALRTVQAHHDLPALWKALLKGEQPAPSRLDDPRTVAVWKQGFDVFHAQLAPAEAEALALALRGAPLGEVCEPFASEADPASAAFEALASWFNEGWIAAIG